MGPQMGPTSLPTQKNRQRRKRVEYIRVGSHKKKLKDNPSLEAKLWQKINNSRFEALPAVEDLSLSEVLNELDYVAYFDMSGTNVPADGKQIVHYLLEDKILLAQDNGLYTISNMGALLFAKRLEKYPMLNRKRVRVIQYEDDTRINILRQDIGGKGYASGFEGLVKYICIHRFIPASYATDFIECSASTLLTRSSFSSGVQ